MTVLASTADVLRRSNVFGGGQPSGHPLVHGFGCSQGGAMHEVEELPVRLRKETADLHLEVEAATGLPGSIRTRAEYVTLLHCLHRFHQAAESRLADSKWAEQWAEVGIDLSQHRRAYLLEQDLVAVQAQASREAPDFFDIADFPGAMGCLYVVEGSSLGGRVIGPAIRSAIGDVPTRFFESAERNHPSPWRSLKDALLRFGSSGDTGAVVEGARSTFRAFERHLATPRRGLVR